MTETPVDALIAKEVDVEAILMAQPGSSEKQGHGPEAAPEQQPPPTTAGEGDGAAPPPAAAPSPAPNEELLQLKKELEELRAFKSGIESAAAAVNQQPAQQQQSEDPVPPYAYNIPDQLVTMLRSEDPREVAAGLQAMATGVSRTVHRMILEQVLSFVPRMVENAVASRQAMDYIRNDFYGTYPEFYRPELVGLVEQTARAVWQETGAKEWTPQFRDAVAQRLRALLAAAAPKVPTPPPAMTSTTVRQDAPAKTNVLQELGLA